MNQEAIKDVEALKKLVNEMLPILEEIYTQLDNENDRKNIVGHAARKKEVLNGLLRVERQFHQQELNDIEAAQNKKLMKYWHKELTKRKMHFEAALQYIQSIKQ